MQGGSGGKNLPGQQNKPYLILISIDGFRWDYQDRYDTPAMDRIAADGIRADAMQPVFPTLTFPNHYSIATGLYPANHGLIGNRFFSPDRAVSIASMTGTQSRTAVGTAVNRYGLQQSETAWSPQLLFCGYRGARE